ncbi:MAG: response regulator, partial [Fibrobacterota bacterium]
VSGPVMVVGDDSMLQNVLINMGINAAHAMPRGGSLTFTLGQKYVTSDDFKDSVFEITDGRHCRIDVEDTGCGMTDAVLEKIFEPFFTTKEKGKGTGLGLSAALGTLQHHGGALTVTSTPGEGTVFTLYLPQVENQKERTVFEEVHQSGEGTILLVDDDDLIRVTGQALLKSLGYSVITASSGEEGLRLYREKANHFDLIIMDMVMPGMSGLEMYQEIRSFESSIPVLLSSGFSREPQVGDMYDDEACGFLQKPYRKADLAAQLRRFLQGE